MKTKGISYLIVGILGLFALAGLLGTWDLIKSAADASAIAVFAGLTGTSLGSVGTLLAQTQASPPQKAPGP
ncbi:hypothetical protein EON81_17830 [bacterium]|nr:MAG: hypothetical protein EON81_17830 [bacterium]